MNAPWTTAMAFQDPAYARALRLALRDPRVLEIDAESRRIRNEEIGPRWMRRIKTLGDERGAIIERALADPAASAPRLVACRPIATEGTTP